MNPSVMLRTALATAVIAVGGATAYAASTAKITPSGVDGVKIGATYTALHQKGLIGKIHHGCELGGPNTRSANLKSPLNGQVNFTLHSPRKVTDITIRGGAKARGRGIGATIAQIKSAFPKAKVDHSTDSTFGLTLVRVPKNGGGKLEFGVSTKTKRATLIGVPFIAFCE
ncbi:MAG: hypothetical protein QOC77_1018 [Thermoleophilaceae bacterium]|jgi:hypothetical protein|nr:hypothetical protein [Thermoleophilaceae bacterium]MEA2469384.1 hypothetical protein [Thermoleophilaceae bacterium]